MLVVETIARIRREHFVKGKTIKEIARDLGVSRNTVRRVLRSGEKRRRELIAGLGSAAIVTLRRAQSSITPTILPTKSTRSLVLFKMSR
jgi:transposase